MFNNKAVICSCILNLMLWSICILDPIINDIMDPINQLDSCLQYIGSRNIVIFILLFYCSINRYCSINSINRFINELFHKINQLPKTVSWLNATWLIESILLSNIYVSIIIIYYLLIYVYYYCIDKEENFCSHHRKV